MKFDIARQPLVPAFLTLATLAVVAMWGAGMHSDLVVTAFGPTGQAGNTVGHGISDTSTLLLPGELLMQFQTVFPGWSRWIGGLLILFTGMSAGRLSIRYNLYSVNTCLAIPLFGAIAAGVAVAGNFLPAFTAATLLALALKNYSRSFCNGFGFDAIFRASLYLGLLPLVSPAALPLLLILPLAILLFRRTVREVAVALAGLLLPMLTFCYINWGTGGAFLAPTTALWSSFIAGMPLSLITTLPLQKLVLLGGILLLDLMAILFFLSDIYAIGTKPRFIFIYIISILMLTVAVLCGPAATPGAIALLALPSAVLLPFLFVRIHRAISLPLYLVLLFAAIISTLLQ